jgi:hypothetical protein
MCIEIRSLSIKCKATDPAKPDAAKAAPQGGAKPAAAPPAGPRRPEWRVDVVRQWQDALAERQER